MSQRHQFHAMEKILDTIGDMIGDIKDKIGETFGLMLSGPIFTLKLKG